VKIGVVFNISDRALTGVDVELTADSDIPATVRAVCAVLKENHHVIPVKFSPGITDYLKESGIDILFNICEGFRNDNLGEAYAAAMFEQSGIPFTGSDFFTLALCMDKARVKELLHCHGLPTPEYQIFRSHHERLSDKLQFPLIVKPLHEDGSIGIYADSVVDSEEELRKAVNKIITVYGQPALVEEYIEGRELNVSIIGNPPNLELLPISEIIFETPPGIPRIVSYEAKWVRDSIQYQKTPGRCPAELDPELLEIIRSICKKTYVITGCRDYARVDLRLRGETPFIIEVNPNPAKYVDSGFVRSAEAAGLTYRDLCFTIIKKTMERCGMDVNKLYEVDSSPAPGIDLIAEDQVIIETKRLISSPVERKHLPVLLRWFNDTRVSIFMDDPDYIYTEEELLEMFFISRVHDLDVIFLDKSSGKEIGYGAINNVNYTVKTGEISFLIGEDRFLSWGYGTEIAGALVRIAFTRFNLESLSASVVTENASSKRILEKLGFQPVGIRRKSHLMGGRFYDQMLYDIVREDYGLDPCNYYG